MFVHNKYFEIYHRLCDRAKGRERVGYTERHHVLPKSLGGVNTADNYVWLTGREHFISHRCLVFCTEGTAYVKMSLAVAMMAKRMSKNGLIKISGRVYEMLRQQHAELMKVVMKGKQNCLGRRLTDETKQKIRVSQLGNQHALGCQRSEDTKRKMSLAKMGHVGCHHNAEMRAQIGRGVRAYHAAL